MKTLRTLACLAAVATAVAAAPSSSIDLAPNGAVATDGIAYEDNSGPMGAGYFYEVNFPSLDGTMIHADVLLPGPPDEAPEGGWPMIISGGPYFAASKYNDPVAGLGPNPIATGPVERFADFIVEEQIFDKGYGWAQFDTRGYGSSQGCNDYGGHGEQADMAAAVDFFGLQEYSNGKVALWGKSYDAWTQVMALAMNPTHLAAAVIQAPLIEGYRLAYDNGVHWDAGWYATTSLYMLYDNQPVGADGDAQEQAQSAESTARAPECWPENQAVATAGYDQSLPYWVERDLRPRASNSQVPTFWTMGFQDVNTKPTNLIGVFGNLEGYHKGWFGHWDHVRGNEVNREDFHAEVLDFLDVHLKGKKAYELGVNAKQQTRIQTQLGDWYTADDFPASDVQMFELDLLTGSYLDGPDNDDAAGDGVWTYTEPFPYTAHYSGEARFHVQASPTVPNSNLLTRIYDVDESGRAELIARGASLLEQDGTVGQGSFVTFDAWPSDFVIEEGHRLAIVLTSTSPEHNPIHTGATVDITSAFVELPFRTVNSVYDEFTETKTPPYGAKLQVSDIDGRTQSDFAFPPAAN